MRRCTKVTYAEKNKSKMVLQFSSSSGVCKMLREFRKGCMKHKIMHWIENKRVASACCLLMHSDFMHRVTALEVNVHGYTETDETLWPCVVGLQRPLQELEAMFVLPLLLFCCYRAAALRHDTLMNRSLPCRIPVGQRSYRECPQAGLRRDKQRREKVKWNKIIVNETNLSLSDYLKYSCFPLDEKHGANTMLFIVG